VLLAVQKLTAEISTDKGVDFSIRDISFDLSAGEGFGIVGASGCGKTLTVLSIMRLIRHLNGQILGGKVLFEGTDLLQANGEALHKIRGRQLSLILQDPQTALNPFYSVGQQIDHVLCVHTKFPRKKRREIIQELIQQVGLPSQYTKRYPCELSGGERQRIVIALAISCQPKIIIADEPTTALDAITQKEILALLQKLKNNDGLAIILVSHDLSIVQEICEKMAVMYAGEFIEIGSCKEIFEKPQHFYTQNLLRHLPRLSENSPSAKLAIDEITNPENFSSGCVFSLCCPLKKSICNEKKPVLEKLKKSTQHRVRCWHMNELYDVS